MHAIAFAIAKKMWTLRKRFNCLSLILKSYIYINGDISLWCQKKSIIPYMETLIFLLGNDIQLSKNGMLSCHGDFLLKPGRASLVILSSC